MRLHGDGPDQPRRERRRGGHDEEDDAGHDRHGGGGVGVEGEQERRRDQQRGREVLDDAVHERRDRPLLEHQPKKTSAVSNRSGSSSFGSASASSRGTSSICVPRSATIFPKVPSVTASTAATPKRVPSTRS